MYETFDDDDSFEKMRDFLGPGAADSQLRSAVQFCWLSLPKPQRNLDNLEADVRRRIDRIFREMRDDEGEASRSN